MIHYHNLANILLNSVQAVKGQLERDKDVIDLVKAMGDVYTFVDAIQSLPNKLKLLEAIIRNILNQTVECAIFIREYTGHGFGGERRRKIVCPKLSR